MALLAASEVGDGIELARALSNNVIDVECGHARTSGRLARAQLLEMSNKGLEQAREGVR